MYGFPRPFTYPEPTWTVFGSQTSGSRHGMQRQRKKTLGSTMVLKRLKREELQYSLQKRAGGMDNQGGGRVPSIALLQNSLHLTLDTYQLGVGSLARSTFQLNRGHIISRAGHEPIFHNRERLPTEMTRQHGTSFLQSVVPLNLRGYVASVPMATVGFAFIDDQNESKFQCVSGKEYFRIYHAMCMWSTTTGIWLAAT